MKKILIGLLAILVLTACSKSNSQKPEVNDDQNQQESAGGWTINENLPEMNDALFDNARQKLSGVSYSPLYVLGTQLVNGKNYMYLAYEKSETKSSFKLITLYNNPGKDLDSEITNVADFNVQDYLDGQGATTPDGLMGGWQDADTLPNMLSDEENVIFEKALEGLTGVGYKPVATLATQVVAGTNYAFLALGTSVTASPVTHIYVINVYNDLDGNAKLQNICGIDLTAFTAKK